MFGTNGCKTEQARCWLVLLMFKVACNTMSLHVASGGRLGDHQWSQATDGLCCGDLAPVRGPDDEKMEPAVVSAFCAYMTTDQNLKEHEPLELMHEDVGATIDTTIEHASKAYHSTEGGGEGRLALVDTACTSCMHSKAWRLAYSQTLPSGYECQRTQRMKTFHFADGSNTGTKIFIWRIPIFMKG